MKLPEIIGGVVLLVSATAGTITWSDLRYALRLETEEEDRGPGGAVPAISRGNQCEADI